MFVEVVRERQNTSRHQMRPENSLISIGPVTVSVFVATALAQVERAPVEIRIPAAPIIVAATDGKRHLAYELHVTDVYRHTAPCP